MIIAITDDHCRVTDADDCGRLHARFEAMIDYAGSKGWLDASGERVVAHLERSTS